MAPARRSPPAGAAPEMPMFHAMLSVETFRLGGDGSAGGPDELLLEGWFATHGPIALMALVLPDGRAIEIEDRRRPSEDVFASRGATFGEAARACRFRLRAATGAAARGPRGAVLRVVGADGLEMRRAVGPMLAETGSAFTPEDRRLASGFESCGADRELGTVQRLIGIDRPGLLRDAAVDDVGALADAIANGFVELEWPDAARAVPRGDEWALHVPGMGIAFDTARRIGTTAPEAVAAEERPRLAALAEAFLRERDAGARIFLHRAAPAEGGEAAGVDATERLAEALGVARGARLLWVDSASAARPHGSVERVRDGLCRGWIEPAAGGVGPARARAWLALLGAASLAFAAEAPA